MPPRTTRRHPPVKSAGSAPATGFLGIDIGTSGTKALVLSAAGRVLATAEAPHRLLTPRPGWTEQHPEEWWTAVIRAVGAVLRKAGKPRIVAIGLSGQMHGSVFLDSAGKVLRPALLWNDQRTASQCAQIEQCAGGRTALIEAVSNPALTGFTAPKILWMRQEEPRRYDKCRQILLPKDYVRYRLTGDYASDVSDASGTLLLDVRRRAWHHDLLAGLGIDATLLPRLVESPEITGTLSALAARELGLPAGIPVVGGAGDQAAGAVGTGVVSPGLISASMGTSGVLFAASPQPQTDPQGRVHTMCHAVPGTWCLFGCMLSAGGSLQYVRNTLYPERVKSLSTGRGDPGVLYEEMIAEAARTPAGAEGLYFLPYLTGERCPHADPHARGAFIGLTPRHARGHLLRAVLEGITHGLRQQIAIFRELGVPIRQIRASGGGARSAFWRQLQADMFNAPVVTINASEGAALGVAILAAVGAGAYPSVPAACDKLIAVRTRSTPRGKAAAFYERAHGGYAALYPALRDWFRREP